MSSEADEQQLASELKAWRQWRAGSGDKPFILERHECYGVCEVLFPSWLDDVKFNLRYSVMYLIGKLPFSSLKVAMYRWMGVRIGKGVYIAPGVFLDAFCPWLIDLADGAFLGIGCRLLTHDYNAGFFRAGAVRVGKGSVVGAWSIVRCGVSIGQRATTGLGSVVVSDVPDGETFGGVPARALKSREANP